MGMMVLTCQPQAQGPSVAPCYDIGGTPYAPVSVDLGIADFDYGQVAQLFGWSLSAVLIAYIIGAVVGSIIRLIRSA